MTGLVLPGWVERVRPAQVDATEAVLREFRDGRRVVFMDAPTGAGKTLIAEMVRQRMGVSGLYVCTSHALQHQVANDFTNGRVLKGRGNYPMSFDPRRTADDCTYEAAREGGEEVPCVGCERSACPYVDAKDQARRSDLAILNTAYWLRENQGHHSAFATRGLVIVDEADTLEGELMGLIEIVLPPGRLKGWGLSAPAKGAHWPTLVAWMERQVLPAIARATRMADKKGKKRLGDLAGRVRFAASSESELWVRSTQHGFVLKPVTVDRWGVARVWSKGERFLCMSATIINPHQMAADLGLIDGEWGSVVVPSTFPIENRPIRVVGIADMKQKGVTAWEERADEMGAAVASVCAMHPMDRILVHTVSHGLGDRVAACVRAALPDRMVLRTSPTGGPVARAEVLSEYRQTPAAVLIAPGLERGVDLADDDCRVMVVAKVPYPNLGDPQVKARAYNGRTGNEWYQTETVRSLVQMTGRGVRTETDWATSYILDRGMHEFTRRSGRLFPAWWADAIDKSYPKQRLMKETDDGQ